MKTGKEKTKCMLDVSSETWKQTSFNKFQTISTTLSCFLPFATLLVIFKRFSHFVLFSTIFSLFNQFNRFQTGSTIFNNV